MGENVRKAIDSIKKKEQQDNENQKAAKEQEKKEQELSEVLGAAFDKHVEKVIIPYMDEFQEDIKDMGLKIFKHGIQDTYRFSEKKRVSFIVQNGAFDERKKHRIISFVFLTTIKSVKPLVHIGISERGKDMLKEGTFDIFNFSKSDIDKFLGDNFGFFEELR